MELYEEFITPDEESRLLEFVKPSGKLTHRLFHRNKVTFYDTVIPEELIPIVQRIGELDGKKINNIQINEYFPGQMAIYHIDSTMAYDNYIYILSLSSPSTINFRVTNDSTIPIKSLNLNPRSLFRFSDEYRYKWSHSIDKVKDLRISLVFRTKL